MLALNFNLCLRYSILIFFSPLERIELHLNLAKIDILKLKHHWSFIFEVNGCGVRIKLQEFILDEFLFGQLCSVRGHNAV